MLEKVIADKLRQELTRIRNNGSQRDFIRCCAYIEVRNILFIVIGLKLLKSLLRIKCLGGAEA